MKEELPENVQPVRIKPPRREKLPEKGVKPDNILKYLIFSLVIDQWETSLDTINDFMEIRKNFDDSFIVAAYAWYFEININRISECFYRGMTMNFRRCGSKQTIGIIVRDYFGGGIEKTVSLLILLYAKNGHKVVLLTDSYMPDKEYGLPQGVERHVMFNKAGEKREERLEELKQYVEEDNIDIMCFHSGYMEIDTFYEMWYLKLCGIPVLMELHSAFFPIITTKKEVSRFVLVNRRSKTLCRLNRRYRRAVGRNKIAVLRRIPSGRCDRFRRCHGNRRHNQR